MTIILDINSAWLVEALQSYGFIVCLVDNRIEITIEPSSAIELQRLGQILEMYE